jgi:hypothetical protein
MQGGLAFLPPDLTKSIHDDASNRSMNQRDGLAARCGTLKFGMNNIMDNIRANTDSSKERDLYERCYARSVGVL